MGNEILKGTVLISFSFVLISLSFLFVCLGLVLLYATLVLKLASKKCSLKANEHSSFNWFLDLYC